MRVLGILGCGLLSAGLLACSLGTRGGGSSAGGGDGVGVAGGAAAGGAAVDPSSPSALSAAGRARADSLLHRDGPPVGLDVIRSLRFSPLRFDPPEPERFELDNGVTVFFLQDASLPLIDVFADVRGGYLYLDRDQYAVAAGMLPLMRSGGTASLPPDSVDDLIEMNALGISTSTNGGSIRLAVSGLTHQLDLVMGLWSELLLRPRFDADAVERWRTRELEAVRRQPDAPGSLAVLEFNRIVYGDHPTGWRMRTSDLAPGSITPERLQALHRRIVCPENAVIGVAGSLDAATTRAALEEALAGWAPCGNTLGRPPGPGVRWDSTVYVVHRPIAQSSIVVGQPGGVLLEESRDYFASRIANWILGGSGLSSRLVTRLRTEEGLAYSVASVWGADREHERILGAITHTGAENTLAAVRSLKDTFRELRDDPPLPGEVELAREAIANGYVFGFASPIQIVARQVAYLADDLPDDWLVRYLAGIRGVEPRDVARLVRRTIEPDRFTVLIVGDTTAFDARVLGPVEFLPAR